MKIDSAGIEEGRYLAEVLAYGPKSAVNFFDSFRSDLATYLQVRGFVRMVADTDWKEMRLFHDDQTEKGITFIYPRAAQMTLEAQDRAATISNSDLALVASFSAPPNSHEGPFWCLSVKTVKTTDGDENNGVGQAVQGLLLVMDQLQANLSALEVSQAA